MATEAEEAASVANDNTLRTQLNEIHPYNKRRTQIILFVGFARRRRKTPSSNVSGQWTVIVLFITCYELFFVGFFFLLLLLLLLLWLHLILNSFVFNRHYDTYEFFIVYLIGIPYVIYTQFICQKALKSRLFYYTIDYKLFYQFISLVTRV